MMSHTAFGVNLRRWRERQGLTQDALSEVLSVERVTVTRWETGQTFPPPKTMRRIAEVTGKPLAWFFEEDDPPQPPFITNILPDVLAGAGLAPEPPPPDVQPPAPQAHAPQGAVDMHDLLAQLVQSQAHLSQAMARMAEGQAELRQGQAEIRKVQTEISRAVADLAAQEQGATRVDVRRGRERAG